jgi:predicted ATP-grasp superfamily ATP-dependent carboligase
VSRAVGAKTVDPAAVGDRPEPTVLVLDGDYDNAVHVATELKRDLDVRVVGVGTSDHSRLVRSRYCDLGVTAPRPGAEGYEPAIRDLVAAVRPDAVVPVGYDSTAALVAASEALPEGTACALPDPEAFAVAADKRRTLALATDLGIPVPRDYTERVRATDRAGRPADALEDLPFPLFLKASVETGRADTAVARSPGSFWDVYDRLCRASGTDALVQEYVDGDSHTYACGLLLLDGGVELLVSHEEVRSVPRRGGSGTRLRLFRQPRLEALSIQLLQELDWTGVALVEFKRRRDGTYVLMEVNPKFWASYALASQCGYRFASTMVAMTLGLETVPRGQPEQRGERVFPLRELAHWYDHRAEESLAACLGAMLWPPARPDVNLTDPVAALTAPADPGGENGDG